MATETKTAAALKIERLAQHTTAMIAVSALVGELSLAASTTRTLREWLAVLSAVVPDSKSADNVLDAISVYKANGFAPFKLDRVCTFATFVSELEDCSVCYSSRGYLTVVFPAADNSTVLRYTLQVRQFTK